MKLIAARPDMSFERYVTETLKRCLIQVIRQFSLEDLEEKSVQGLMLVEKQELLM
jgi:hypothetical protein